MSNPALEKLVDDAIELHALAQGLELLMGEMRHEPTPASNAASALMSIVVDRAELIANRIFAIQQEVGNHNHTL